MTLGSVITETIFITDPHAAHRSGSISKTRLSSRARLAREDEGPGSACVIADQVLSRVGDLGREGVDQLQWIEESATRGR